MIFYRLFLDLSAFYLHLLAYHKRHEQYSSYYGKSKRQNLFSSFETHNEHLTAYSFAPID